MEASEFVPRKSSAKELVLAKYPKAIAEWYQGDSYGPGDPSGYRINFRNKWWWFSDGTVAWPTAEEAWTCAAIGVWMGIGTGQRKMILPEG